MVGNGGCRGRNTSSPGLLPTDQPPQTPQDFIRRKENEVIISEQLQGRMQRGSRNDFMNLQLIRHPQHSADLDATVLCHPAQRSVAREQDAVPDFFSEREREAVVELQPIVLIEVAARALHECARQAPQL